MINIDLAVLVSRFGARLHTFGVPVTSAMTGRLADAIALTRVTTVDELYWIARTCLVSDRRHFGAFDGVFAEVFRGVALPYDRRANPNVAADVHSTPGIAADPTASPQRRSDAESERASTTTSPLTSTDDDSTEDSDGEFDGDSVLAAASDVERLHDRPFAACTPEELARLQRLVTALRLSPPMRVSRRTRPSRRGDGVDVRATLRTSRTTGGDPLRIVRRQTRIRRRRVVLLADVSGSMESYGRTYLYLLHGAVRSIGAEAFVFATRLHRLTRQLSLQEPARAMAQAMAAAPDWSGGTRLGSALASFNNDHGRRGLARRAIVVIVSDGWETGPADVLGREMERLARLAHRIVWVNPRRQRDDYRPLVGGMAAALPYVDQFLSGHSLRALMDVAEAIATDTPRSQRGARAGAGRRTDPSSAPEPDQTAAIRAEPAIGVVPPTSMDPEYGRVVSEAPSVRWDFFSGRPGS